MRTKFIDGLYVEDKDPDEIFAGCIHLYKNIWENTDQTISLIENEINSSEDLYWSEATVINNDIFQKDRTNKHISLNQLATSSNPLRKIYNDFYILILTVCSNYSRKYNIGTLYHEEYNILKYSGGEEYKAHFDGSTETGRSLSVILYLNDNYEGGELEFPHFNVKFKPEMGDMFLFPSNYAYAHIAHPIISGTKYAFVTWLHDRPSGIGFNN